MAFTFERTETVICDDYGAPIITIEHKFSDDDDDTYHVHGMDYNEEELEELFETLAGILGYDLTDN